MKQHFDLAGGEFEGVTTFGETDADGKFPLVLKMGKETREVANVTFTLRVGCLTPMAARELYESLEDAPEEFREILGQYYFDISGEDINDPLRAVQT